MKGVVVLRSPLESSTRYPSLSGIHHTLKHRPMGDRVVPSGSILPPSSAHSFPPSPSFSITCPSCIMLALVVAGKEDNGGHSTDHPGHCDRRGFWRIGLLPVQQLHGVRQVHGLGNLHEQAQHCQEESQPARDRAVLFHGEGAWWPLKIILRQWGTWGDLELGVLVWRAVFKHPSFRSGHIWRLSLHLKAQTPTSCMCLTGTPKRKDAPNYTTKKIFSLTT